MARFTSVVAGANLQAYTGLKASFSCISPSTTNTAVAKCSSKRQSLLDLVGYALMPRYEPTIETKEKMIVPVIDITANSMLRNVALWLKQQK
jgi:hypothetical protein